MPRPELPSEAEQQVSLSVDPGSDLKTSDWQMVGATGVSSEGVPILVTVKPPAGTERCPVDICCVVDVSGSMGAEAMLKVEDGSYQGRGLSVMDIVKHAMRTIIRNLTDVDRMALVAYSNDAQTIFTLTEMTEEGRASSEGHLDALQPAGMTNLWDGLKTGMDILRELFEPGRLQHVMLFTDGLPNINPPRGILPMLKRLKDKEGGKLPCTINTFGFGYELDSELLSQLAKDGSGAYAFIPDPGFVGTVFVNSMANLLVTMAKDTVLTLEPAGGATISTVLGGFPSSTGANGSIRVDLGSLQYGQSKEVVVHMVVPPDAVDEGYVKASLAYGTRAGAYAGAEMRSESVGRGSGSPERFRATEMARLRLSFVDTVRAGMKAVKLTPADRAKEKQMPLEIAQAMIAQLSGNMRASPLSSSEAMQALLEDLEGQVSEAFSREDWYTKWGIHYLPSLMFAHLMQQCNNFKDAGVQHYGGGLFNDLRDAADEIFLNLPAPTPTRPPQPPQAAAGPAYAPYAPPPVQAAAPISMAAFHDRFAGCIAGDSSVLMADGTERRVDEIQKGDVLAALAEAGLAEVACVVRTRVPDGSLPLSTLPGGLRVTGHHPVLLDGEWRFPADVAEPVEQACDAVYTFVLDEGARAMIVDGVPCVPLGHEVEEGAARHPFLGSRAAVRELSELPGYGSGLVDLGGACRAVRDPETGLICSFAQF